MYTIQDLFELYADPDFYDAEFFGRKDDIEFYKDICQGCDKVLEVACGTGRITIPLAKSGVNIVGTDISESMILKARINALKEGVDSNFSVGDARFTKGCYDLIFIAANAFQHLLSFEHSLEFLKACRCSLSSKGKLIVDVQMPNIKKLSRKNGEWRPYKTFNYFGKEVVANIQGCYENVTQIYRFYIKYHHDDNILKNKRVAMRMYFTQELKLMFSLAGFSIFKAYGSYDKNDLNELSEKQIFVLEPS